MSQERVPRRFDADEIERARLTSELAALQARQRELEAGIARTTQRLRVGRHAAGRDTTGEVVSAAPVPAVREGGGRPAVFARQDHERAMMRAKLLNGATAGDQLVEHLQFAYVQAGKPSLAKLGERVGYSKATLSKVLSGKMPPTWQLVRKLGEALRVPAPFVAQEWHALWIAADLYRTRRAGMVRGSAAVVIPGAATGPTSALTAQTGYTCPQCGTFVLDTISHTDWHMRMEPSRQAAPATESVRGRNVDSHEISLIKEALRTDGQD
jgi:DNA-binding XRE family transcriptional regulator